MSINNQCETQPTLTNLHPMNTVMNYTTIHPFAVKLGSCIGSCNTLNDLSHKLRVPKKTEDLNRFKRFHLESCYMYVVVKMVKYLRSVFDDDSVIRCDEIIEE